MHTCPECDQACTCSGDIEDHDTGDEYYVECCHCYDGADDGRDDYRCPTCKGDGTVNPLTAPADFFCVGTTDCPHCDGTGEING